ncbi:hypothetical protein AMTR_s00098p00071030 [Amborella trichopoda]|uniref:Uncharacterized protein n=1 Tax=Amborella trichopoda TaxID=13333 RepID=W1NX07_AMBTC|nr:hypothetical protein AMTR_s00098p00071030 [Amborella trichopoda]
MGGNVYSSGDWYGYFEIAGYDAWDLMVKRWPSYYESLESCECHVHRSGHEGYVHQASHEGYVYNASHDGYVHQASHEDYVHETSHEGNVHQALCGPWVP